MKLAPQVPSYRKQKHARSPEGADLASRDECGIREAFSHHPVYISHRHVFKRRARLWMWGAYVSFIIAIIAVMVGILIFVFADRIAINYPRLTTLEHQREELREQLQDAKKADTETGSVGIIAPRVNEAWRGLSEVLRDLPSYHKKLNNDDTRENALTDIGHWGIYDEDHQDSMELLGLLSRDVDPRVSTEVTFKEILSQNSVTPESIRRAIETALNCAKHLGIGMNDSLSEELTKELANTSTFLGSENTKNSLADIGDAIESATKEAEKARLADGERKTLILDLEHRLQTLDDEISQIYQKVNPNNIYSVVPLLVIRLGAVILLIFLTQIFLAAYRYNASLSTHFDAVADALYLAPSDLPKDQLRSGEFFAFVKNLHAHDATYLLPDSPISQVRALASSGKES